MLGAILVLVILAYIGDDEDDAGDDGAPGVIDIVKTEVEMSAMCGEDLSLWEWIVDYLMADEDYDALSNEELAAIVVTLPYLCEKWREVGNSDFARLMNDEIAREQWFVSIRDDTFVRDYEAALEDFEAGGAMRKRLEDAGLSISAK